MKYSIIILSGLLLSSCMQSSAGVAFVNNSTEAVAAYNGVKISKTGTSCSETYLGIAAIGSNSIEEAKENGNITNVATVDTKFKNIFGIYQHACTVVKGN
jgi:PBP1b-binding outer membrane lipoprotein LpoB